MTEKDARSRLDQYLQRIAGDTNHQPPTAWAGHVPRAEQVDCETWVFWFSEPPRPEGVVVSATHCAPFWGALGKLVPHLGLPQTRQRFLASSPHGCYQLYRDGIAVWEGQPDIGFPIPTLPSAVQAGRQCQAIVAFFDLRGFTSWSNKRTAAEIQDIVRAMEEEFQAAFSKNWCRHLFTKGTGDGFMLISEAGWFGGTEEDVTGFQRGHAAMFASACSTLIRQARPRLDAELAIGCGITLGEITQVFLLGRPDYIGSPVNEAAKIQQIAWDELCVSELFRSAMAADGVAPRADRLGDRGWRIGAQDCIEAAAAIPEARDG
jgi:class 3 adenylate cyclase